MTRAKNSLLGAGVWSWSWSGVAAHFGMADRVTEIHTKIFGEVVGAQLVVHDANHEAPLLSQVSGQGESCPEYITVTGFAT